MPDIAYDVYSNKQHILYLDPGLATKLDQQERLQHSIDWHIDELIRCVDRLVAVSRAHVTHTPLLAVTCLTSSFAASIALWRYLALMSHIHRYLPLLA